MTDRAALLQEIETLPTRYIDEVFDYVKELRQKSQAEPAAQNEETNENEIDAYMAMAADDEREQEACEWCNAYFGPADTRPVQ